MCVFIPLRCISPGCGIVGSYVNSLRQYFGHLMQRTDYWKRPWCWERLKTGGEGDDRGWDGWMASPTHWMWVWVNSRSWWWTGRPDVLQSVGSQRVRHDWATEVKIYIFCHFYKVLIIFTLDIVFHLMSLFSPPGPSISHILSSLSPFYPLYRKLCRGQNFL